MAIAVKDTTSAQLYQLYSATYPVTPCSADGQTTIDKARYHLSALGVRFINSENLEIT